MKTGRAPKEITPYKVIIHKNGGRKYASTKVVISEQNGKKEYRHKHWGTIDQENKFHPNDAFLLTPASERDKLIFPEGIDLTEIGGIPAVNRVDSSVPADSSVYVYEPGDQDRQYGATWFLDKVSEVTGIKADLRKVFQNTNDTDSVVNVILTLSYFLFLENLSLTHVQQWQQEVRTPSTITLTPERITQLFQSITAQHRNEMFGCRASHIAKEELGVGHDGLCLDPGGFCVSPSELCAIESTSISAYGGLLSDIKLGKTREGLPMTQTVDVTVDVVVYSLKNHMPIFYMEFPGNRSESTTLETILKRLAEEGFKNLIIITQRGYESVKNVQAYISSGHKVVTSVKASENDVLKCIRSIGLSSGVPTGMEFDVDSELFYAQYDSSNSYPNDKDDIGMRLKGENLKSFKINLYFSLLRRALIAQELMLEINNQTIQAQAIRDSKEKIHKSRVNELDYLDLEIENNQLKGFSVNEKKRNERLETAGFFAYKSIGLDWSPLEVLHKCHIRDEQEKCFQKPRSTLSPEMLLSSPRIHDLGRGFISFIYLILSSYITNIWMQNNHLRKKYRTVEEMVRSLRTIRCFEREGHITFITPFNPDQADICKAFGFEMPKGCPTS